MADRVRVPLSGDRPGLLARFRIGLDFGPAMPVETWQPLDGPGRQDVSAVFGSAAQLFRNRRTPLGAVAMPLVPLIVPVALAMLVGQDHPDQAETAR